MPTVNLKGVTKRGCMKPNCKTSYTLNRHHKKHEAMWLGIWASRRRLEPKWRAFVERYHEFLPEDIVDICSRHHAEIHLLYDVIIQEDILEIGRPLSRYSWGQAERLMRKLEETCNTWLKLPTPGVHPKTFAHRRRERQKHRN